MVTASSSEPVFTKMMRMLVSFIRWLRSGWTINRSGIRFSTGSDQAQPLVHSVYVGSTPVDLIARDAFEEMSLGPLDVWGHEVRGFFLADFNDGCVARKTTRKWISVQADVQGVYELGHLVVQVAVKDQ